MTPKGRAVEEIEVSLFLEAVYQRYGYDFRDYAPASLHRRLQKAMLDEKAATISALQDKVLHDPASMERFVLTVSIDVTSMFREPEFYRTFRTKVVPLLRENPHIRIWHAGCATGEEVFSMAILLTEEGLIARTLLYATDMNETLLEKAKAGVFPAARMKPYTEAYIRSGGTGSFSDYYTARYDNAIFRKDLQKNVVWAVHSLATDASFNEFHLIVCRNVMIYFNAALQARVHKLFFDSLAPGGVLALGIKESLRFSELESRYTALDKEHRLYRRLE